MGVSSDDEFRAWAEGSRSLLRRTAFLLCADWYLADDLVQDTLVRMYDAWPRLRGTGDVTPYARRVLVTRFLDHRRRPSRREAPTAALLDGEGRDAPEVSLLGERLLLLESLRSIPAGQRAVLVLRFWADLSVEETAALLGCTGGTVKSQTHRGVESMRAALAARGLDAAFDLMEQP